MWAQHWFTHCTPQENWQTNARAQEVQTEGGHLASILIFLYLQEEVIAKGWLLKHASALMHVMCKHATGLFSSHGRDDTRTIRLSYGISGIQTCSRDCHTQCHFNKHCWSETQCDLMSEQGFCFTIKESNVRYGTFVRTARLFILAMLEIASWIARLMLSSSSWWTFTYLYQIDSNSGCHHRRWVWS